MLDFGDVYNYGDTERILFVGGRTSEAVIYISKTLLTNISIHADIGNFNLGDDIQTLSNVQVSEYTPVNSTIVVAVNNVAGASPFTLTNFEEYTPGGYHIALNLLSETINDLEFGSTYSFAINYTCVLDINYASISYEIVDIDNNTVSWASFDQATGSLLVTPLAYDTDQFVDVYLKSNINYIGINQTSDNPLFKPIYLNVKAAS